MTIPSNVPSIRVYDHPETMTLSALEDVANVEPSRRCVNCGGYAEPQAAVGDSDAGCKCEGDYRPSWKAAKDEIARRQPRPAPGLRFNETRVVDRSAFDPTGAVEGVARFVVRGYSILTTDVVVFDVYEPMVSPRHHSHSTSTRTEEHGWLGSVRSRTLPSELAGLPYGNERTARVTAWFASLNVFCEEIIRAAFPEYGAAIKMHRGEGLSTLTLLAEAVEGPEARS